MKVQGSESPEAVALFDFGYPSNAKLRKKMNYAAVLALRIYQPSASAVRKVYLVRKGEKALGVLPMIFPRTPIYSVSGKGTDSSQGKLGSFRTDAFLFIPFSELIQKEPGGEIFVELDDSKKPLRVLTLPIPKSAQGKSTKAEKSVNGLPPDPATVLSLVFERYCYGD